MDGEQQPGPNHPAPTPSVPPVVSKPKDPIPEEAATAQQLEDVEKQMTGFERATLRWARAAVIMSGLAAIFVCLQWWEMHAGSKDTHNLAVAAANQATWTQNLAADMKTQADRTKDLADRMKEQADETKTIADQAVIQANANTKSAQNAVDTLSNTKQSFRDEQRAWIGVQGTSDTKGFTEKLPWQVTVVFFNSGRTPAQNVQSSGGYITSGVPISGPSAQQIATLDFRPAQSIAPQGYYREMIGTEVSAEAVTSIEISGEQTLISQYTQIKNKKLFLYYFGLLKYDDTFGKPHETQFCILLANPDTKKAGMCDAFNDLN
ncbi:MAG TPA: hypothetical protein VHX20_18660 [Terracidiphilus sp.]|jgi:hypothetical protein|nr:hypothetical protein [Terracidiphilus sp.]